MHNFAIHSQFSTIFQLQTTTDLLLFETVTILLVEDTMAQGLHRVV
jgi:hypothetical protein